MAAIDTGSNAIRYLEAEFQSPFQYREVRSERAAVRLGHGVFLTGKLTADAMKAAVESFKQFGGYMRRAGIDHYRAVATSAVREASNGKAFVERVALETGIELQVINGSEEARLALSAIRSRVPLGKDPWVLVDVGGGSVEVAVIDDTGILWSESHTMGSVRLLEELTGTDSDPGRFRRILQEYVSRLRSPVQRVNPAGMIGTGGNIESLSEISGATKETPNGVRILEVSQLRQVIDTISRLSYHERIKMLKLKEDRADVILPAALIYERVAGLCGVSRIHVPNVGVKNGVALDLVDRLTGGASRLERLEREVVQAAVNLGRRYQFDETHAMHVHKLAHQLFDKLRAVHGLDPKWKPILSSAAILHDIGSYISRKKHHRHSYYLIRHSEVSGLSPQEVNMVATVSRFHRKQHPDPDHQALAAFPPEERTAVAGLAALLRIADGLDSEHKQAVSQVEVAGGNPLTMTLRGDGDLLLELLQVRRRAQMFAKLFNVSVEFQLAAS